MDPVQRALFEVVPRLRSAAHFVPLGQLPTPIEPLSALAKRLGRAQADIYVKRDDRTSPVYGGNKVRTLEVLFGVAQRREASRIYATGAYGSNHAVATVLHAPRAGLSAGVLLFPQPPSTTAIENLRVTVAKCAAARALPHWSALPGALVLAHAADRFHKRRTFWMVPGGATPEGALGYVSAAFELALQVASGELPNPRAVVVGVGSTCTSAGLLTGFALAARLGIGFVDSTGRSAPPRLCSIRVTPWPVTSKYRIVSLAAKTSALLAELAGDSRLRVDRTTLSALLTVDGHYLGKGYGYPTSQGREALELFADTEGPPLDTTYSAKSAAALVERVRRSESGPLLYWATKSSAALPQVSALPATTPASMVRWIERHDQRENPSSRK